MNYFFVVQARMVHMTALDIQVSLRNEMANLSVFSSNMAAMHVRTLHCWKDVLNET